MTGALDCAAVVEFVSQTANCLSSQGVSGADL